jgi:hypothetical protein
MPSGRKGRRHRPRRLPARAMRRARTLSDRCRAPGTREWPGCDALGETNAQKYADTCQPMTPLTCPPPSAPRGPCPPRPSAHLRRVNNRSEDPCQMSRLPRAHPTKGAPHRQDAVIGVVMIDRRSWGLLPRSGSHADMPRITSQPSTSPTGQSVAVSRPPHGVHRQSIAARSCIPSADQPALASVSWRKPPRGRQRRSRRGRPLPSTTWSHHGHPDNPSMTAYRDRS